MFSLFWEPQHRQPPVSFLLPRRHGALPMSLPVWPMLGCRADNQPLEITMHSRLALAGLLLELLGEIPVKGREITAGGFRFTIESIEKRRIREISAEKKGEGI